jgi:hypothetical protein
MDVELYEGRVTDTAEAVYLSGVNDEDVARAGFTFFPVDGPESAAFPHELDFNVRMAVGPGTAPGEGAEEEHGDIHVTVISPNELMRAALRWQILLTDAIHRPATPLWWLRGAGYLASLPTHDAVLRWRGPAFSLYRRRNSRGLIPNATRKL